MVIVKDLGENARPTGWATNVCRVKCAKLPAGANVLITQIACDIFSNPGSLVRLTDFGIAKATPLGLTRPLPMTAIPHGEQFATATAESSVLLLAGQVPAFEVDLQTNGEVGLLCKITGQRPSPI